MLKNLVIFLAFFFTLQHVSSSSNSVISKINTHDFCNSMGIKCSPRNAPHVYSCGPSFCSRKETEFQDFMSLNELIKQTPLIDYLNIVNGNKHHTMNSQLKEHFNRFRSKIKTCTHTRYEWQPSDVCMRDKKCFQNQLNYQRSAIFYRTNRVSCPCPKEKPYKCGSQSNHCSASKEACDSFRFMEKSRNQPKGCDNGLILIQ